MIPIHEQMPPPYRYFTARCNLTARTFTNMWIKSAFNDFYLSEGSFTHWKITKNDEYLTCKVIKNRLQ